MANAWIIEPLSFTVFETSRVLRGSPANMANDYGGVVVQFAAETGGGSNVAYWRVDFGADRQFDTILLFGVDGVPANAVVEVFYARNADGPFTGPSNGWSAGSAWAGSVLPSSGKVRSLLQAPGPITARYVQVAVALAGPGGGVELSRMVIGARIELERNFSFGASFGVKDLGSLEFSRRGVLLRNRGAKLRTISLTFSNVRKDEVEAQTKPLLERIGNTECVAIVTDPAPDDQRQNRCYFGPLVGDLGHTWRRAGAWEAKANLVSIF